MAAEHKSRAIRKGNLAHPTTKPSTHDPPPQQFEDLPKSADHMREVLPSTQAAKDLEARWRQGTETSTLHPRVPLGTLTWELARRRNSQWYCRAPPARVPPTRKDSTTASRNAHHHVALVLSICATEAARLAIISTHMPTTMPKICPQLSHERNAIRPKLSKLFHVPIVQQRATPAKVAPRLPAKNPDCVATCCRGHPYQFLSKARTIPCNYGPHICRESNNEPTEKTNSMKETGRNIATRGCPPIPGMHSSIGTSLIPHNCRKSDLTRPPA